MKDHIEDSACPGCGNQLFWKTEESCQCPECGMVWNYVDPSTLQDNPTEQNSDSAPTDYVLTLGMKLPVIAPLSSGYFLVAHPNGAAIANETTLVCPSFPEIPDKIREEAIDELSKWAAKQPTYPKPPDQFLPAQAESTNRWCPDRCPITLRPFVCWIEHPTKGLVPTYGGPLDSYTLAEPSNLPELGKIKRQDIEFVCDRYDHDEGAWVEGPEDPGLRIVSEEKLIELGAWPD